MRVSLVRRSRLPSAVPRWRLTHAHTRSASPYNQFLTLLGFIHICMQPLFTHVINSSLTRNPTLLKQYDVILRLCFVGGARRRATTAMDDARV